MMEPEANEIEIPHFADSQLKVQSVNGILTVTLNEVGDEKNCEQTKSTLILNQYEECISETKEVVFSNNSQNSVQLENDKEGDAVLKQELMFDKNLQQNCDNGQNVKMTENLATNFSENDCLLNMLKKQEMVLTNSVEYGKFEEKNIVGSSNLLNCNKSDETFSKCDLSSDDAELSSVSGSSVSSGIINTDMDTSQTSERSNDLLSNAAESDNGDAVDIRLSQKENNSLNADIDSNISFSNVTLQSDNSSLSTVVDGLKLEQCEQYNNFAQHIGNVNEIVNDNVMCRDVVLDSFKDNVPASASEPANGLKHNLMNSISFQTQLVEVQDQLQRYKENYEKVSEQLTEVCKERDNILEQLHNVKSQEIKNEVSMEEQYILQAKELETTITRLEAELNATKERLVSQDAAARRAIASIQAEAKSKVEHLTQKLDDITKEKNTTVMRYAQSEQKNIELQDKMQKAESKLKDAVKEVETMKAKLKSLGAEKQKFQDGLENRNTEVIALKRDLEKYKEMLTSADIRTKWAQSKMQADMDSSKEMKNKLDDAMRRLREARDELDQVKYDLQAMVRSWQSQQNVEERVTVSDNNNKDAEQRPDMTAAEQKQISQTIRRELDVLKKSFREMADESKVLRDRIVRLDAERLSQDEIQAKYRETIQSQKNELKDLKEKSTKVDNLVEQVKSEQTRARQLQLQIDEMQQLVQDMRGDVENASIRETNHLEMTKKLTDRNAQLQSDNSSLKSKLDQLSSEVEQLNTQCALLEQRNKALEVDLLGEKKLRSNETVELRSAADASSRNAEELARKLEEVEDELRTAKRKHAAIVKDLTRQLTMTKKRLESVESAPSGGENIAHAATMGSRTSSNNSLDAAGVSGGVARSSSEMSQSLSQDGPLVEVIEVDKQLLLDKIVRLQKLQARRQEKIDFLEEHVTQLLSEVKKKSRIIQQYALREETGALAPEAMDINKAEHAKRGGVMASLYSLQSQDGAMTMDLALEIGKKLQAVLEDTMLKNITLKDNLDTLGKEISRLSQENRRLQLQLQGHGKSDKD